MNAVLIRNARVVTLAGGEIPRRGAELRELTILPVADVLIDDDRIAQVRSGLAAPAGAEVIEADGRVCLPGFVDAHTHAIWAGDRLDEIDLKQRGATYLEILESGGGIMSTVRAVRAASREQLAESLRRRLRWALREGTTTMEVKSGYGLTTADELKSLRAIRDASEGFPGTVVPTALIAHAIDPEQPAFIETTINETLPAVHAEFPGIAIDAYCERGAWSPEDCRRLFECAAALGHPMRVHADQFNALGMLDLAIEMGFVSVDHLEATGAGALQRLAHSGVFGVMLPCSGFQVDDRYADGRAFVDAGGALVIATNCNPGSAPTSSMPMAIALATRKLGLTTAEAIAACTVNAQALLGFGDRGVIAPGRRADLILLRHTDERMLGYEFGGDPVACVVCGGSVVRPLR
ncbi:MAG: imidazolonepropionase [Phycisphaeraceae bacterium]|nr:imidazolonepropionase [Phycisphaeraceae bacterium]